MLHSRPESVRYHFEKASRYRINERRCPVLEVGDIRLPFLKKLNYDWRIRGYYEKNNFMYYSGIVCNNGYGEYFISGTHEGQNDEGQNGRKNVV